MVPPATWSRLDEHDVDAAVALARCFMRCGDFGQAVQVAEAVVDGPTPPVWSERFIALGAMLLSVYRERGDLLRARIWGAQLQQAAERVGTASAQMTALRARALLAVEEGREAEAVGLAEQALALCPAEAGVAVRVWAVMAWAEVVLAVWPTRASQCQARLLSLQQDMRGVDAQGQQAELACLLARAELLGGRVEQAAKHLQAIAARAETLPPLLRLGYHLLAGQVIAALEQPESARRVIDQVRQQLEGEPATRHSSQGWRLAAQVLAELGQVDDSVAAYQRALERTGL
ncbi:hypothetical protein ACFFMN_28200 [Planobispora siamensis]|nr:hypothetical protein [Planobispora siamensis]